MPSVPESADKKNRKSADRIHIRQFFNHIAGRYDFLNGLLSLRLDDGWRRKSCRMLLEGDEKSLLDLGVGTGKFIEVFSQKQEWSTLAGLDFAEAMLHTAKKQIEAPVHFVSADFEALPFCDESFDLVVSSFTLRSVQNLTQFLRETYRVLKPGGKAGLLCLTRPRNPAVKLFYLPYMKWYLPFIGGLFSGSSNAYRFLSDSVLGFQEPEQTAEKMTAAGFRETRLQRFTFGLATLIWARK